MVYKLYKALYGLNKAPRVWNKRIDTFFLSHSFKRCSVEYGLYAKYKQGEILLLVCLYMDNLLITRKSQLQIEELKSTMKSKFEMTDLGNLSYFLSMMFLYKEDEILSSNIVFLIMRTNSIKLDNTSYN